jgi:hypothetical protein
MQLFRRRQTIELPTLLPYASDLASDHQAPVAHLAERITFDGLTEGQRVVGEITITGRLSDALNLREPLLISNVRVSPVSTGDTAFTADPTYTSVDPYGFEIVVLSQGSLPDFGPAEQVARKIRKTSHDVQIDLGPYKVTGTIWLHSDAVVEELLGRITKLYMPVTDAVVTLGGQVLDLGGADSVLVNRYELRAIQERGV